MITGLILEPLILTTVHEVPREMFRAPSQAVRSQARAGQGLWLTCNPSLMSHGKYHAAGTGDCRCRGRGRSLGNLPSGPLEGPCSGPGLFFSFLFK